MGTLRTLVCLVVSVWYAPLASADQITIRAVGSTIYSNTRDTLATTGVGGSNNNVIIDDVLVPSHRNPLNRPLAITGVTVLVSGHPGDDDTFSLWSYPVQADGSAGLGRELIDTARVTLEDRGGHVQRRSANPCLVIRLAVPPHREQDASNTSS